MDDMLRTKEQFELSELSRALLESASDGILLGDGTGRIILVNAAATRMFGYSRTELMGQPLEILLPERIRGAHIAHRAGYFAAPRVRPMGIGLDLSGRRKDGSEFPLEISLSHVGSDDGMVAMAFVTDITVRKRGEAESQRQREVLHQTEKMAALGTLVAGIAHELNNPLGIMTARIEVMLLEAEEQHLPTQVIEDLQVLSRAAQRVARIASSLRSFARPSHDELQPVDLNALVDETLQLMQKPLEVDAIRVVTNLDRALPPMLGDATALQQVLLNLLTNAREAIVREGEIQIESALSAERAGCLRLAVTDTGPGISPENLVKIFDPFYTTKRTGTGLGLSVSYGIIQSHKGIVDVQSTPGVGTTFVLLFPVLPT
jgi:PAS domain S-box-containing protein